MDGKIALVTGAGTGIGRACMIMFAREGAKVFGVSRTLLNLEETLGLVNDVGGEGSVFSADLSIPIGRRRRLTNVSKNTAASTFC